MLWWIAILGGWLLMMGQHSRSESLFYHFRIEDHQVPEDTPVANWKPTCRSISHIGDELRDPCSETGRPSIDPEVLLRILLLGYLYGITRERKLTFGRLSFRCYKTDMSKLFPS